MAAPYSLDLRERVVAAVAAGMSRKRAAAHYQVSHSSVIRWTRREAETGSPAALPMGGKKPFTLPVKRRGYGLVLKRSRISPDANCSRN